MEVFAIGHEYGHHIAQHNAGDAACSSVSYENSLRFELEADEIAWTVSAMLGAAGFAGEPTKVVNAWMQSGAGAVLFLVAADLIRQTRQVLTTGRVSDKQSLTHPSAKQRLKALRDWPAFAHHPLRAEFHHRRRFLDRLLVGTFNQLAPRFWAAHRAGIRPQTIAVVGSE
jgi:hypothetical protein